MSEEARILLRIYCSKRARPHEIGHVVRDTAGLLVRYKSAVRRNLTGNDANDFEKRDCCTRPEDEFSALYCPSCRKRYFLPVPSMLASLNAGKKAFQVTGRGELVGQGRGVPFGHQPPQV